MAPPREKNTGKNPGNPGAMTRGFSRRSLLTGTAALGAMGVLGAAGCSRVPSVGNVEGGDLLPRLRDSGTVRIGIASEPPFGYIDKHGEAAGEAPAIAEVVFKRLGIKNVEPVPVEFSALIPGLQAQQFDVVSAGMYIDATRCQQVLFADPDYLMPDAFLVKKGNPKKITRYEDIKKTGAKMASGEAYAEIGYAVAAGIPRGDILILPDQVAGLDAVEQGRVDVFAGTNITVREVVKGSTRAEATEAFQPIVNGEPAYGAGGFAFRQSEKNFRDAFNREIHKLKRNNYKELLEIVGPYGFTIDEMTDLTAEELCA